MAIRNQKGLTLVELMILVVIFCALVALAVPRFIDARDKAVCRQIVIDVANAEKDFFAKHDCYTSNMNALANSQDVEKFLVDYPDVTLTIEAGGDSPQTFKVTAAKGKFQASTDIFLTLEVKKK